MKIHFFTAQFYIAFILFRVQGSGLSWRIRRLFLEDGILDTTPFPDGKGKEEGASPPQKEANPASLRSAVKW